jgi:hypothetical protein
VLGVVVVSEIVPGPFGIDPSGSAAAPGAAVIARASTAFRDRSWKYGDGAFDRLVISTLRIPVRRAAKTTRKAVAIEARSAPDSRA